MSTGMIMSPTMSASLRLKPGASETERDATLSQQTNSEEKVSPLQTAGGVESEFKATGTIVGLVGDASIAFSRISAIETSEPGDLVFADKAEYLEIVQMRRPSVVVTTPRLQGAFAGVPGLAVLLAPSVPLAHALIKGRYASRDYSASGWQGAHPHASIEPTATIGAGATVEPNAVVGKNARLGARARVMAGAIVEHDAIIGEDAIVHPRAVIGYRCRVGSSAVIGAGAVIGSEGYGFAQDAQRKSYAIPQTGIVVIEDRVRVGAGCCIDRATYEETRIGAGTKLDNLCHVAHNVRIGEDCLLTAMFCVAGSTEIGNRVIASGQTGVLDHLKVCDDAVLLHRAGVSQAIEEPGAYAGIPAQPLGEYLKNSAALKTIAEMRKRLLRLERLLEATESKAK
jgi:UDP-3-O-[3-hydroxymyristoyl] glucosamine N-acyltransferase